MAQIAGMKAYQKPEYKTFWSEYTGSPEGMKKAVAILNASPHVDLATLEWARYQPLLAPLDKWENLGSRFWAKETGSARLHLIEQPNNEPLSKDEPNVIPKTRLGLLDAAIRKCFNSDPPIPIDVEINEQQKTSADRDTHTVKIAWVYGKGEDKPPTRFKYTMTCPFRESEPGSGDIK